MAIARRQFFRQMFTGLGAAAALPALGESAWRGNWRTIQAGGPSGLVRLDANENAYGPCPQAFAALQGSAEMANRYPKTEYGDLLAAIAAKHGVGKERVVLGCGSSENLRMAVNAFLGPGKTLIMASPTFEFIGHLAEPGGT